MKPNKLMKKVETFITREVNASQHVWFSRVHSPQTISYQYLPNQKLSHHLIDFTLSCHNICLMKSLPKSKNINKYNFLPPKDFTLKGKVQSYRVGLFPSPSFKQRVVKK